MIETHQSTARVVMLKLFLSSDHVTAATGKTVAITISKAGAAFGNPNAGATNATEVASGWYKVTLDTTDTNTVGDLVVRGTAASCDDTERIFSIVKATNRGMTALPDVATGSAGAVLTSGTGTAQLSVTSGVGLAQLADGVAHGGTPGSSTATIAAKTLHLQSTDTHALVAIASGASKSGVRLEASGANGSGIEVITSGTTFAAVSIDHESTAGAAFQIYANDTNAVTIESAKTNGLGVQLRADRALEILGGYSSGEGDGVLVSADGANKNAIVLTPGAGGSGVSGTIADLRTLKLDRLVSAAVVGADVTDNSIIAKIVSKSATADWDTYTNTTDSLEAASDSLAAVSTATNAGDLASKTADAGSITTGTNTSGSYTDTASDNDTYWITAPVTPAVGGFGLRQSLRFDLPLSRVPTSLELRGWWNGSGQTADVYALNIRTGLYDKLTNTGTNLISRSNETVYSIILPRDYSDDTGGVNNIVTIELRSTSTNTAHRLRVDRALVYHVAESASFTMSAPTVNDIWTAPSRTLTSPGEESTTPPTADEVATAVLLAADSDPINAVISGVTFPTNFGSLGINGSGHISRVTLTDTTTALTGLPILGTTGTVNADGSETTSSFKTNLTQADNFHNRAFLLFTSGALTGQTRRISDYSNASGLVTLNTALTAVPANGVTFTILGRSE